MKFFQAITKILFICTFSILFIACKAGAESDNKKDNGKFAQSVKSIFDKAKDLNYLEFRPLVSQRGLVVVRYYSAGNHNTNFVNEIPFEKIPKNLDFSNSAKSRERLTIPGMLESLKSAGASPSLPNCELSEINASEFNFKELLSNKSDGSKAAQVAEHFHHIFSSDQNAQKDIIQICLANKGNSQAYYGLITTPEDSGNSLIYGALFIFEMENSQWRLRGLAEFL